MYSSDDPTKHVMTSFLSCFFLNPERVRRYPSLRRTCLRFLYEPFVCVNTIGFRVFIFDMCSFERLLDVDVDVDVDVLMKWVVSGHTGSTRF